MGYRRADLDVSSRIPPGQMGHVEIGTDTYPLHYMGTWQADDLRNSAAIIYHEGNVVTGSDGFDYLCIARTSAAPPTADWMLFDKTQYFLDSRRVWVKILAQGLLGGFGGIDIAVTNPGGLIVRYQCDEASGDLIDTAGHPSGPHNATYVEVTSGVDTQGGAHATWDGSQAVSRQVIDHSEFGAGDNGSLRFNYNQLHVKNGDNFPGSYFVCADSQITWHHSVPNPSFEMQSISFFFKPSSLGTITQGILGKSGFSETNDGYNGWSCQWNPSANTFLFVVENGGGPPARVFSLDPGGALAPDVWYHVAITLDPAADLWCLYMNGVLVDSIVKNTSFDVPGYTGLEIGKCRGFGGSFVDNSTYDSFFLGEIDEIDIYSITLTLADVQAIFAAAGPGFGTTVSTVTIGGGSSTNPFAVRSGTATDDQFLASDGAGGTTFRTPTIATYHNGV